MTKANVHGFISEIENICECSICCNGFDDQEHIPRVLPCQHVFCTKCLSKHCKRQRLKCPLCNEDYYLKNGNVITLPKDYTICHLKELLEKLSRSLCKECNNHTHVQYFCKTCNTQLCQVCYSKRKMAQCSKHDIEKQLITSSSQIMPTRAIDTQSSSICFIPDHEKNELKYFCSEKSCCKAICSNCIVESHKEHVYRPIKDEYEERKKIMLRFCRATRDKITNAEIFLDTIRQNQRNVTTLAIKGQLELEIQATRGIKYIKDFQEKAEETANEKTQSYLRMLERREEQVKSFIENSTECCAISEEALSTESMISFLSVEKTLMEKLKLFEKSDVDEILGPMPPASNFELQKPKLELEGKVDLLISDSGGTKKSISSFKEIMKLIAFVFLALFLFVCLLLILYYPVPYSLVFKIDETHLALRKKESSQLCISTDRRMFSNIPMEDMKQTCGSTQTPYVFRGAFTNTSFVHGKRKRVAFYVDVSGIQSYFPGSILFEFGVSKGSIERLNLLGPLSDDFVGWMLTVLNSEKEVALINTEGRIVHSSIISAFDKASYVYYLELRPNSAFLLKIKDKNEKSYKILDETRSIRGEHKVGFAKMCPSLKANVTVKLISSNITFNRSTLYPNMYIARNNRTISNIPKTSFTKSGQEKNHAFQDITLQNCNVNCVYVLNFRVDKPANKDIFTLVLTNSKFLPSAHYNVTLMTYTECPGTRSFCFVAYKNNLTYAFIPMTPNKWQTIIIMVNRKRKSASFIVGTHELDLENGYIFEADTPILRFVSHSTEDSVKIYLADRDNFHILTWITCKVCKFVRYMFSDNIFIIIVLTFVIIHEIFRDRQSNKVATARVIPRNSTNMTNKLFPQHHTSSTTRRRRR